jgi:GR25 family glycosyltransferase involved in LPS biosynthesis
MNHIDCIYYINLGHRKDRYEHICNEFQRMNIPNDKIHRIDAVRHEKGYIGCGKSHILALNHALENNYEHIIIFEDDFKFVVSSDHFETALSHLFTKEPSFNLCLLAFSIWMPIHHDDFLDKVICAQTTSGYIVSKKYIPTLLQNYIESTNHLENFAPYSTYGIDQYWKRLQGIDKGWFAFKQRIGVQIESYSDIEGKVTNYGC